MTICRTASLSFTTLSSDIATSVFEVDIALLGPHCVHVIDVKGTRGLVDVYGSKWYPQGRAPYHSPLAILRSHAKALKSLICDQHPTDRALGRMHVEAAVLMTEPDAMSKTPVRMCTFFKTPASRSTGAQDASHRRARSAEKRASLRQ